jgi:glutaminyl-peptide cyclotransferase
MGRRSWVCIALVIGGVALSVGLWLVWPSGVPGRGVISPPTQSPTIAPAATAVARATPTPAPTVFDPDQAYRYVLEQCGFGARPTGSVNNRRVGDYLIEVVGQFGWSVEVQEFTYQEVPGRNIIARKGSGPVVILGAHYDTRPYADRDPPETQQQHILGANDGASGVAVLLELARVLDMKDVPYEVRLLFFDAEDRGNLAGWPFSVGAKMYADALEAEPVYVVVVDMVGDREQTLYWDRNSDSGLNDQIWRLASEMGYGEFFVPEQRWQMIDDHLPFIQRGWKAIDIIDFDYPYWHTTQDTADKVSGASLARVGKVLEALLEGVAG